MGNLNFLGSKRNLRKANFKRSLHVRVRVRVRGGVVVVVVIVFRRVILSMILN